MKIVLVIIVSVLILSACEKEKKCIAKDANGNPLFEVVGTDLCEDQISPENGEYCDCSE